MSLYLGNVLIPGVAIGDSATQEDLQTELDEQKTIIKNIKQVITNNQLSIKSVSEYYDQKIAELKANYEIKLAEMNESWAGELLFNGTNATSTYFTQEGCFLAVDRQTETAFITIQGASNTDWENIHFTNHTLPKGITALPVQKPLGTGGDSRAYFTQVLTGVKQKINVIATFGTATSTTDSIEVSLTVTYA